MSENPIVLIETSSGEILVELFEDKAPETVANFLEYIDNEFYKNTIFHRVIKDFMVQGGGMDIHMAEKETNAGVKNEADNGLENELGTLAMARTMDPNSATAQFFINLNDNKFLNHTEPTMEGWGYCVFGKVIDGIEIVEKIGKVKTSNHGMHGDVPVESIVITDISRF